MTLVMDWEAGENPALPRNCKRAKLAATVHSHGKATAAVRLAKPGDRRERNDNPFRVQRRTTVQFIRILFFLLIASTVFASDLRVRVTDPNHAPVSGARVAIYEGQSVIAVQATAADGTVQFHNL